MPQLQTGFRKESLLPAPESPARCRFASTRSVTPPVTVVCPGHARLSRLVAPRRHSGHHFLTAHTSSDTMADIDDDVIVVDDVDDHDAFQPSHRASASKAPARTQPARASRGVARRQSTPPYADSEGRTTRSTARGPKLQPKLKLKLSEKAAAQAPGMSFLGAYDRELDSDDEDLVFEEQFILRMPPGEDCERLRKMVQAREVSDDVWFKFKGAPFQTPHVAEHTNKEHIRLPESGFPYWKQYICLQTC